MKEAIIIISIIVIIFGGAIYTKRFLENSSNKIISKLEELKEEILVAKKSEEREKVKELSNEIYDKWDGLTDVQQKGLSEAIAGKTQAAVFQSLMTGWERVNQFRKEYSEGLMVGSAEKEKQYSPFIQECVKDIDLIAGNP